MLGRGVLCGAKPRVPLKAVLATMVLGEVALGRAALPVRGRYESPLAPTHAAWRARRATDSPAFDRRRTVGLSALGGSARSCGTHP